MEMLESLQAVYKGDIETILTLSSDSIYWNSPIRVKFHTLDHVVGYKKSDRNLILAAFSKTKFKFYYFSILADNPQFFDKLNHKIFAEPKHLLIIYNPMSGSKNSKSFLEQRFLPILEYTRNSYEIFESSESGLSEEILERIGNVLTNIICLGGDGTLQHILNSIFSRNAGLLSKITVGILPTGSRNSLACELYGKSLSKAMFCVLKGKACVGDLFKIKMEGKEVVGTTAVLWGSVAQTTYEAEKYKFLGISRYILVGLKNVAFSWKSNQASVQGIDKDNNHFEINGKFTALTFGNAKALNYDNNECPFPLACIDDRCFDFVAYSEMGRIRVLNIFFQLANNGAHVNSPLVSYKKCKYCKVQAEKEQVLAIDGEFYFTKSYEIECLPSFLKFFTS